MAESSTIMTYYKTLSAHFLQNSSYIDTNEINYSRSVPQLDDEKSQHFEQMLKQYPNYPVEDVFCMSELSTNRFPWEFVYEIVRRDYFPNLPKRTESYFVFDNLSDAREWQRRRSDYTVCQVHVEFLHDSFTGDMYYLDSVEINASYNEILESVSNYWSGNISHAPNIETMLQGKLRLIPI